MLDKELTFRGLILGAIIAAVFTAANVYLGLKVGLTIASSIPAAVISMGILRAFKTGNIRENNIVQTVASAGGTLSSIVFVLPGLVMLGYWNGFPFWATFLVCTLGGFLGVMFSIPLRRALVVNTPLPFPEGVAAAEVLKVGAHGDEASPNALEREKGPLIVLWAALVAAFMQIVTFTGAAAATLTKTFRTGVYAATGVDFGFSLALLGAGHLVGLSVGIAQLIGVLICWAVFVPMWTHVDPGGDVAAVVTETWRRVRFVGAGAIGVAAIWSLIKLVKPVIDGMIATAQANKARGSASGAYEDRDIPSLMIVGISALSLAGVGWLLWDFMQGTPLAAMSPVLIGGGLIYVVVVGFFVATVAGYMAALIGASNSPVSGIGILATVIGAYLLSLFVAPSLGVGATQALVAFALFSVSIVFTVATISNDNLQDLKTGQLVGASPWKQQVALLVGVVAGSIVIPLILNVLNHSYGFPGDPNRDAVMAEPLNAPQATLISTIALGVLNANLDWFTIGIGAGLGVALCVLDEILGALKLMRLPPLAVGIGIYLPMSSTIAVTFGAITGWFYERAANKSPNAEMLKRFGVLMASGLIVGESMLGVLNAAVVAATENDAPFRLPFFGEGFAPIAEIIAVVMFVVLTFGLYRWVWAQTKSRAK
ncbi:MAG: oligopeptide transporter, OPT family [Alphaproteobacteria bacterium]|nr:oligopeptide transporter, OPT family [Alphaproteobacteria bacterium]